MYLLREPVVFNQLEHLLTITSREQYEKLFLLQIHQQRSILIYSDNMLFRKIGFPSFYGLPLQPVSSFLNSMSLYIIPYFSTMQIFYHFITSFLLK